MFKYVEYAKSNSPMSDIPQTLIVSKYLCVYLAEYRTPEEKYKSVARVE
jgi:hypothetical protein